MPIQLRSFLIFIVSAILGSCTAFQTVSWKEPVAPRHAISQGPVLIVSAVNPESLEYREKKNQEFGVLVDRLMDRLGVVLQENNVGVEVVHGYRVKLSNQDSSLMAVAGGKSYPATIVISSFDAYFSGTRDEVQEPGSSTVEKVVNYDLVTRANYKVSKSGTLAFDTVQFASIYYGNKSGSLASISPNIVKNQDMAIRTATLNADLFARNFIPWTRNRSRTFYASTSYTFDKSFLAYTKAVERGEYEKAFELSKKYLNHSNKGVAARAHINCAVMCEVLGRKEEILPYLQKVQGAYKWMAEDMLKDYGPK